MKQKIYGSIITSIAVILLGILLFQMVSGFALFNRSEIPEEYAENITTYSNGDYIYQSEDENLVLDEEEYTIFYDNLLVVFLESELSQGEKQELADSVEGTIVGDIRGCINVLQILVDETDLEGINEKSEILMESELVTYAGYDFPVDISPSASDQNPWSSNANETISDKGVEQNPYGNDWWAEAIGAYTAWEYAEDAETVKVGIVDTSFDLEHNEFDGRISMHPDYEDNSEDSHGTGVAGIIGAANNTEGLRGISSNAELLCIAGFSEDSSTLVIIEYFKQLVESGTKVINMSGGLYSYSKARWADEYGTDDGFYIRGLISGLVTYDEYLEIMNSTSNITAIYCIAMMEQLLMNGEDVLFVKSAGNGWDNGGPGHDATYDGGFCAITEELYNSIYHMVSSPISYEEIDSHILVVGAVQNIRNATGGYQMTDFSNYGETVDICAPGETIFTTDKDGGYNFLFGGTSAAAPMVTGSAALLWSINPELTAPQVRNLLLTQYSSEAFGYSDISIRYPMLNVGKAAKAAYEYKQNVEEAEEITDIVSDDELLEEKLAELVDIYGVIETGTEEFPGTELEIPVPAERITGLLCADIFDYDGDGSKELLTVRFEAFDGTTEWGGPLDLYLYITVYGEVKDGMVTSVELIDEKEISYHGLQDGAHSSSIQLARGEAGEKASLYLDYYYCMNTQSFGVIQIVYDGELSVTGGVECSEFSSSAVCESCVSEEALTNLAGQQRALERDGWTSGSWYEYDWESDIEELFEPYHQEYKNELKKIDLTDSASRSYMILAESKTGVSHLYNNCSVRPTEHYSLSGGTLTDLCGIISPYAQGGVTLTCYDEVGILDVYR